MQFHLARFHLAQAVGHTQDEGCTQSQGRTQSVGRTQAGGVLKQGKGRPKACL